MLNNVYPISLGHNCTPAYHIQMLGLRTHALPFDSLLLTPYCALNDVADLIETNFQYFLSDLSYNQDGHVVPGKHPHVRFFHHDPIKNLVSQGEISHQSTSANQLGEQENLIQTFREEPSVLCR